MLLPSTLGKVEVEGTIFLYIESVKFHPLTSRSTKIDVAGSIFENYQPLTRGRGGDMGCRKGPKYVQGGASWPQLGIASCPFWPHRFPHFGLHTSGEGGGGGGGVSLTCAGILEQSMGARNQLGIGLSYRPTWLHRLAELIPWNWCHGPLKV